MTKPQKKPAQLDDLVEVITDVEQNTEAWHSLRLGTPTASRFSAIMANGKDGQSIGRRKLLYQLAGEIITGETAETFQSAAMLRGLEMEAEARDYYARTRFADLARVGFVRRTVRKPLGTEFVVGCSPDSFVGQNKLLEIKTMRPDLLIEVALKGAAGFPTEHKAQCQGSLWVTGREEIDLMLFYRGMPVAPTFTMARDETYIATISDAVETFVYDLNQLVAKIRSMGAR